MTLLKNKNIITYISDDVKTTVKIFPDKVELIRESSEFIHHISYSLHNQTSSEYYIKEFTTSIYFNIYTTHLCVKENYLKISYQLEESEEDKKFIYLLKVSEK